MNEAQTPDWDGEVLYERKFHPGLQWRWNEDDTVCLSDKGDRELVGYGVIKAPAWVLLEIARQIGESGLRRGIVIGKPPQYQGYSNTGELNEMKLLERTF